MKKLLAFFAVMAFTATAHANVFTRNLDSQVRIAGSAVVVTDTHTDWRLDTSCTDIVANESTVVKAPVRKIRLGTSIKIVTNDSVQRCRVTDIQAQQANYIAAR